MNELDKILFIGGSRHLTFDNVPKAIVESADNYYVARNNDDCDCEIYEFVQLTVIQKPSKVQLFCLCLVEKEYPLHSLLEGKGYMQCTLKEIFQLVKNKNKQHNKKNKLEGKILNYQQDS